ncbi:DUF3618 domain-containing protein [Chelativorans sp.]|uniref:DUF3618 domain-containing protein n=1 Tax=Chelativorans sp. TaxID=2203393 RepID=UPI00281155CC|nr:DUF3618 domain-containing protein [Chelativorans sp.]
MTQKSSAELAREAEAVRARMTETAETLQHKLSPGQLIDELGNYFKNSDGSVALENLKTQVRDNPLPLALVGVGLAWLFMGGGPKAGTLAEQMRGSTASSGSEPWSADPDLQGSGLGMTPGELTGGDEGGDSVFGRGASALSDAGSSVSSTFRSAAEGARSAGHRMGAAGHGAASRLASGGSQAQRMFRDTLEQEPLIIGALGVAVGAAIGAMLPRTRIEEDTLAPYGAAVRESVTEKVSSGIERAKEAASAAFQTEGDEEKQDEAGR